MSNFVKCFGSSKNQIKTAITSSSSTQTTSRQFHSSAIVLGKFGSNRKHKGSLSSKHMPKGWYKGSGARPMGRHTRKGKYIIDPKKVPQFSIPDMTDCKLQPYVNKRTPLIKVAPPTYEDALKLMLEQHKAEGIEPNTFPPSQTATPSDR